mgnify:CR=1 FL=1
MKKFTLFFTFAFCLIIISCKSQKNTSSNNSIDLAVEYANTIKTKDVKIFVTKTEKTFGDANT